MIVSGNISEKAEEQLEEQKSLLHDHHVIKATTATEISKSPQKPTNKPSTPSVSRSSSLKAMLTPKSPKRRLMANTKPSSVKSPSQSSSSGLTNSLSFKRSLKGSLKSKTKIVEKSPKISSPKKSPRKMGLAMCSLPPTMVPVEPDDSSYSERRPPPLPRFVLHPNRLTDSITDPRFKGWIFQKIGFN